MKFTITMTENEEPLFNQILKYIRRACPAVKVKESTNNPDRKCYYLSLTPHEKS